MRMRLWLVGRQRTDAHVSERHGVVIALQAQWARTIRSLARLSGPHRSDIDIVQYFLSVVEDRQPAADEMNVEGLPLTWRFRRVRRRSDFAIERAAAVGRWRFAVVVEDLHFVFVAHVHARVAPGG